MRAGIVTALAFAVALVLVATAGAAVRPVGVTHSQAAILDHGFKVKLANNGRTARRVRVKVKSRTFDDPGVGEARADQAGAPAARSCKRLRLKLTAAAARGQSRRARPGDLRVRAGGNQRCAT